VPFDFFHALNSYVFVRGRRTWSIAIAVVMAIIAGGTFGVWYWHSIVNQRLPDWTWSKTGSGLVTDRIPESKLQVPCILKFDLTVVNKGPGPSYQIVAKHWLSRDAKLSADDVEGGQTGLGLPGETIWSYHLVNCSNVQNFLYNKPPPGFYYLILVLDPLNLIAETDEGNNAIALKFEICPGTQC
jgi:hypothetical protein